MPVFFRDGEIRTAKVPTATKQEDSVGRGGAGGWRRRRRSLHARDDGCDKRAARAQGRAHGVRHERGFRAPSASAAPEPRLALQAVRATSRAAGAARALVRLCAGGWGPSGELAPLELDSLPRSTRRRRDLPPPRLPGHVARACGRSRGAPSAARRRTSSRRTRSLPSSASTSERRRRRSTRTSARSCRATCARLRSAARRGLPEPLVMRSSGGVAELDEAAAHPAIALVSVRRRARRRGARRDAAGTRTRSPSTWAGRRRMCA
jgi:hypothetical protein